MKKLIITAILLAAVLAFCGACFADVGGPTLAELDVYVSNPEGAVLTLRGADEEVTFLVPFGTKLTLDGFRMDSDFAPVSGSENSPLEPGWNMWEVSYRDISPFEPEMSPEDDYAQVYYTAVTGGDGINVFKGPDGWLYGQCGVLPAGTFVKVLCYDSDLWGYVEYGDVKGWAEAGPYVTFYSEFARVYAEGSEDLACTARVKQGGCRVYGLDGSNIEGSLLEGDEVIILKEDVSASGSALTEPVLTAAYGVGSEMRVGKLDASSVTLDAAKVEAPPEEKDYPFSYHFGIENLDAGSYKIQIEAENGTGLYAGPGYFYEKCGELKYGDEAVLMNLAEYRGAFWLYVSAGGVRGWIPAEDKTEPANTFGQAPQTWSLPLKESLELRAGIEIAIYDSMTGGNKVGTLPEGTYAECTKMTFEGSFFPVYYVNYDGASGWLDLNNTWAEFDEYENFCELGDMFIPLKPGEEVTPEEEPGQPEETPAEEEKPEEPEKKEEVKPEETAEQKPSEAPQEEKQEEKPAKKMSLKTVLLLCALASAVLCATALATIRLISCKKNDKGIE